MITLNFVGDNIGDYYSTEDYYQQREDKTGELLGAGVKAFGFNPTQRQHEQFTAHVADRVGITKKDGTYEQPRKALDLTFSTSKSVSILYGLAIEAGDHELAQQIVDNQKEAVRQTLKHMEEEGYFTTLVKDAEGNTHRHKAVDLVFELVETHLDNRDGQLQMHVHALAGNKCHAEGDPSGQERAVDFGYVFNNQKNIDFIEKQYEAAGLEKMGFSVEMLRDKKGNESFRVAGITAEEEKVYSKRRAAIEESIKTRLGKSIDQATAKEREYANLITRQGKKKNKSIDEMEKGWKADHVAAGLSLDIILERNRELIAQRSQEQAAFTIKQNQQDFLQQQYQQQYQQQEIQQQQYQQQQYQQQIEYQQRQQAERQAAQRAQEAAARRREAASPKPTHTIRYIYHDSPTYSTPTTETPRPEYDNAHDFGGFGGLDGGMGGGEKPWPMVFKTGLEDATLPPNWLNMTDPEREAWRRDQLSHDPGPSARGNAPTQPEDWWNTRPLTAAEEERYEHLTEVFSEEYPDATDQERTEYFRQNWHPDEPAMGQATATEPQIQTEPETPSQPEDWWNTRPLTAAEEERYERLAEVFSEDHPDATDQERTEYFRQNWHPDEQAPDQAVTQGATIEATQPEPQPTPEPAGPDWWTTRDWTPREAAEYARLVEDFYSQHPTGTEQERYAFLREHWKPEIEVIDPRKEVVRQALQNCEDLRGVWTAQTAYNDARKAAIAPNIPLDLDDFKKQFDALRAEKGIVDLPGQDESWLTKRYTTQAVLDADRYIQHVARHENQYDAKLIDPEQSAKYTEEFSARLQAKKGFPLLSDQVNAVKHIAENSDKLVTGIQGRAGTGKSTGVALLVVDQVGRDKVTCLATAAAAAGNLGEAVEVDDAKTIASFVKQYEKGDEATLAKLQDGIIILDEAGMTGSVEMAKVIKIAQENNARVILIGDTDQLAPVSAGCPFLELQERAAEGVGMQTAELRQIVRQKDAAAREAVLHVVDGETKEALEYLIETNQIIEIKEKPARYKEIIELKTQGLVEDFTEGRDIASDKKEKSDYLCMVSTNAARDKINNGVRKSLQEQGALDKSQDRIFTVSDKEGNTTEKRFSPGDHIIFLQNDKKVGVSNSDLAQIQSIEDKSITAKLASGDVVTFNADSYNRFDYGYALTTYKAQGATQRRAIYDADSKSPLLNKNEFYVGLSRFTEEVHIFTDSKSKMAAKIQRSQEKRSALAEYEKGHARENGHKYVEAVEAAHERRKSADLETKNKQRRLIHSYYGDYRRVPREFRDMIDQEFESHRKQFAVYIDAAKEKFGDKNDSATKDLSQSIKKWKENQQKIKVDGIKAEAIARQKGAITKEERAAKKNAGPVPEWQKEYLARDPEARARAEQAKLVNAARRSHQSLDKRLAAAHAANDKTFEKKLTEYTPRRQLAEELKRREELAAARSDTPPVAAKDRPAHLEAERKAAAVFQAIREAEVVQKDTVRQIAADQREAKAQAEKAKQEFGPEERKPFIQRYQAANAQFRESVKDAVTKHCDSPEAGQAIHDALDKWQRGQDAIKKASTKNVRAYIAIRDRKQPPPTKSELAAAKAEFEKGNEHAKKLYKASKAQLDKTFDNIKTFIKETELRKYYESQGRTPPEATIKPIRSKDQDGKETVAFRAPDQSARKTRNEKEIADMVAEYRGLTEQPKNPFMRDLAQTRAAWESDRNAINAAKAKELEALQAKDPAIRELPDDRQKHYRERHANATGLFKSRVEELVAKLGGDQATAKKIMDSLKAWQSRRTDITKKSSALYKDGDGKPRTPTAEEKTAIIAKYRYNDARLDKDFDAVRKELDAVQKTKKKAKSKEVAKDREVVPEKTKANSREKGKDKAVAKEGTKEIASEKANGRAPEKPQTPENAAPDKAYEFKNEKKGRDPKAIAADLDAALRQDEAKFFDEIDQATKDGIKVSIPDRKTEVKGILVGQMRGKDGKHYAIIASGSGNYAAVPANGDMRAMMGKPVLAGRGGITPQGEPTKGSNAINNFMLSRGIVAKQFSAKMSKMMQKRLDSGKEMEFSI